MAATHAPAGYSAEHPLTVGGRNFVGGEFIPGDVMANATAQEKAAVQGQQGASAPAAQPSPQLPVASRAAFPSTPEADAFADANIDAQPLTPEDQGAVAAYRKSDAVYQINNFLRDKKSLGQKIFGLGAKNRETINQLDKAIAKNKTKVPMTVMRGFRLMSGEKPAAEMFKPGSVFSDGAFVSTTLASNVAERFSRTSYADAERVIVSIDLPQGSSAYHMPRVEGEFNEAELLLPRGARFQVHSVAKDEAGITQVKVKYIGTQQPGANPQSSVSLSAAVARIDPMSRFVWATHHLTFEPPAHVGLSSSDPMDFSEQVESVSEHQQSADRLAAAVIKLAEKGGMAISSEIRRESLALVRRLVDRQLDPQQFLREFMKDFRMILHKYDPIMARLVSDAQLAAFLEGGQSVLRSLPPDVAPAPDPLMNFWQRMEQKPPEPPEWARPEAGPGEGPVYIEYPIIKEAAADLAHRQILLPEDYYATRQLARMQGFTVSNVASLDAIERVRDILTEAVVDGDNLRTFKGKIAEAIDASQLSPSRQEVIFRTVVMGSYARGQKAVVEHPLVRSAALWAWRSEIDDSRLTQLCKILSSSGLPMANGSRSAIFFVEDPVWSIVAPNSHFGCRCTGIYLTTERAAAKGILVAQKWLETGIRPPDSELFVPMPDLTSLSASDQAQFAAWQSPWAA